MALQSTTPLKSISDVRRYFHCNETPIIFISATNFNLLGIDEWVRNFTYINYIDCFDGRHPTVLVPREMPHAEFQSIEDINNYLLQHPDALAAVRAAGPDPKAVFLMFDETTEALAQAAGLDVWFPKASLRTRVDNKIETVRIGNKAGVPSVPNVLAEVRSYAELRRTAGHLGEQLVVQTAFGDSGHTTYFIACERDWDRYQADIVEAGEVKIMKRIRCLGTAIEACTTRCGTVVGPLMTELVGFAELTPYKGGWCGNEILPNAFTPEIRATAHRFAERIGDQLRSEGYRGYFELDLLIDRDTGEIWLGELNPRITGASSITNHAAFAHADVPLFLFHLLEFSGQPFDLDVAEINARWALPENIDTWSQMVIKHTDETVDILTDAPQSGIWRLDQDGGVHYARFDYHRRAIRSEDDAFFLRISGPGDFRYQGADLGILVTRGRLMTDHFTLNPRARAWLAGIQRHFRARPLLPAGGHTRLEPGAFKML